MNADASDDTAGSLAADAPGASGERGVEVRRVKKDSALRPGGEGVVCEAKSEALVHRVWGFE